MRGVSTWAVAVRKPAPEQLRRGRARRRGGPARRDRGRQPPADVASSRSTACCGCRSSAASSRSASRWPSASRRWASAPTPSCPRTSRRSPAACGPARCVVAILLAVGLFFVDPGRADVADQGRAQLVVPVLARRGHPAHRRSSSATCCCSRACATCAACSSTTAPSTRRSPATRPACDLTPGQRAALQPPAPALRHELPAHRHDRRDLRLRPDRPARLVLAGADAHRRRPADRRHLLRAHQVRRQEPPPRAGSAPSCGRACSSRSSPPASPTSTSSPSPSPP